MMRAFNFLLCFFLIAASAFAQKAMMPRFANEQELTQRLNQLILKQQSIDFLAPLQDLQHSPSAQNALYLAASKIKGEKEASLAVALERIGQYRKIDQADKTTAIALETQYLDIEQEIVQLKLLQSLLSQFTEETNPIATELDFYQVHKDQRIAELGAGDPAFAKKLLSRITPQQYYLNDIDPQAVQMISDFFYLWSKEVEVFPILGESRSTQLEGQQLDAIIIRNALHHFDELPAMLSSIKASLAPNGRLLIKETFTESCFGLCCPYIRPEAELLQALEQAGFVLDRRSTIHETSTTWHLLEYSSQKNTQH